MNTTKIAIPDILSLREDLNSSWLLLHQESEPVKAAILQRFKDTEARIGTTTDIGAIQRLHNFTKFLKASATAMDCMDNFIARMMKILDSLDDAYWTGVFEGYQFREENRSLKADVEALETRCRILENGLMSSLNKRRKDRVAVDKISNKSKQAAA